MIVPRGVVATAVVIPIAEFHLHLKKMMKGEGEILQIRLVKISPQVP